MFFFIYFFSRGCVHRVQSWQIGQDNSSQQDRSEGKDAVDWDVQTAW